MNFPLTLIDLAGTIALLLSGVRMVQTCVQLAFGPKLRLILAAPLRSGFKAFLAGLGVTAILKQHGDQLDGNRSCVWRAGGT